MLNPHAIKVTGTTNEDAFSSGGADDPFARN
jgi:hypothetical protein